MYVTIADYESRFGASSAPADFNRKEEIAVQLVKHISPQKFPLDTELGNFPQIIQDGIKNGLLEMIYTFDNDYETFEVSPMSGGTGFTIGKFSAGGGIQFDNTQSLRRLSPNAYLYFSNIGLFDMGISVKHPIYND
jgi:hypothetical protein